MRAAIVLAAGSSRRFGGADKLLARVAGRPMLAHAVRAALAAPVARVLVVVGLGAQRIEAVARRCGSRVRIVRARDHRRGMAASLIAGVAALRAIEREAFVFLGDMPSVPRGAARRLARFAAYDAAVRPRYRGRPGHPVLVPAALLSQVERLRGDHGLRDVPTHWIEAGRGCVADIDRRGDLKAVRDLTGKH